MRIVAGAWRGRTLEAPAGSATRPTADRVRQALFDMLAHAPWAEPLDGCHVLDAFAGSGALGLEALSRGAAQASFFETDRSALMALQANISTLDAARLCRVYPRSCTATGPAPAHHEPARLVFLDPPYGKGLIDSSLANLRDGGWISSNALIVAEAGRAEAATLQNLLAARTYGAASLSIWRVSP